MSEEPEDQQDDVLELEEDQIIEPDDDQQPEEPEELEIVGFADEADDEKQDDPLVKRLRGELRETQRRIKELSAQKPVAAEPEIVVGPRPKAVDFDYDDDRLEEALDEWESRKTAAEKQAQKRQQAEQGQQEQWAKVTQDYAAKKAALRYPDVQQAEQTALDTLSPTAQALIAKHADNSALFMYAVGKSPTKLAELARIDAEGDPFAVVKAVTKMEATLTTKRSNARPPAPDVPVRGKPIAAGGADKQLEKLEKEAERTGDRSAIIAFKRAQKDNAK